MTTPPSAPPARPQQRSAIAEQTQARYRRPDRLQVGDPVPPLALARLDGSGTVRLDAFAGRQPLVLIFGSCT